MHTAALADFLADQGDDVRLVFAPNPRFEVGNEVIAPSHRSVRFIRAATSSGKVRRSCLLAWGVLRRTSDVVFLGKGGPGDTSLYFDLPVALRTPLVVFEHDAPPIDGDFPPPIVWKLWRPSLGLHWRIPHLLLGIRHRIASRVVTNSESTKEKQARFHGGRVGEVVCLGVDLARFQPTSPLLGAPIAGLRIGLIGRADTEMKGLDLAFAAIAELRRTSSVPLEVVFPVPPSQREKIAVLVEAAGVLPIMRLIDPVSPDDLPRLYASLDALLIASRYEGGPYTMLEAMACGIPVIATPVGLVPQVIEDGVNGIRVECTNSVPALVNALRRFLALSADQRREMGERAKATVVEHHDAKRHFGRLREILHEAARR